MPARNGHTSPRCVGATEWLRPPQSNFGTTSVRLGEGRIQKLARKRHQRNGLDF